MTIQLTELISAVDVLEQIGRKIFDTMEPLWDQDEQDLKLALAVLRRLVREMNETGRTLT